MGLSRLATITTTLAAALALAPAATALGTLETQKLVPADGKAFDRFGDHVALDGDVAVVSASFDQSAYVYRNDGSGWLFEQELEASNFSTIGVAADVEGDQLLAGGWHEAAFFFLWNGAIWVEGPTLASPAPAGSLFGQSLAFRGDVAIVGASGEDPPSNAGAAYLFRWNGSSWDFEQRLQEDPTTNGRFGRAVAIDGDVAAVGGPEAVYVFRWNGSSWALEQKLEESLPAPPGSGASYGSSVALEGDVLLVGAPHSIPQGSAHLYRFGGTSWELEQSLLASSAEAGIGFGDSVAIDADRVLVGALWEGAAYLFGFDGSVWTEERKFVASDGVPAVSGGVALSGDTVLTGAPGDDTSGESSGAAYVFATDPPPVPGLPLPLLALLAVALAGTARLRRTRRTPSRSAHGRRPG